MKDQEEEDNLTLFLDLRKDDIFHFQNSDEFDAPPGSETGSSPTFKILSSPRTVGDKNDYDWLLTPPTTPFMELEKNIIYQNGSPKVCPVELKPTLTDCQVEPPSKRTSPSKKITSPSLDSSSAKSCGTSSSDSQISTTSKPGSPNEHHTTLLSAKSSRHASIPSSEPTVPVTRSSASSARNSSPTTRHIVPSRKSVSRSGTPTVRPSKPLTSVSAPPGRSSSVGRLGPSTRNLTPSRGSSTVRSRPQKPAEVPGLSSDAHQDSKTVMTKRPVLSSISRRQTLDSNERSKRCSPTRGKSLNGRPYSNGGLFPAARRTHSNEGEDVSPVQIGTNMVERVVNSRKLAPPKKGNQSAEKPSSHNSPGFGRTLSKSSLEMALRHMDIGKGLTENLRPLKTKVRASPLLDAKSGMARNRSTSVSDSPLATSSNASSVLSANSTTLSFDASEPDDDLVR